MEDLTNVNKLMLEAVKLAKKAIKIGEIPVGAIICSDTKIISYGMNRVESKNCQVYHAEVDAIIKASKILKNWRLNGFSLVTTLKPCPMCLSLCALSRLDKIFYCLDNPLSFVKAPANIKLIKIPDVFGYKDLLKSFFRLLRIKEEKAL